MKFIRLIKECPILISTVIIALFLTCVGFAFKGKEVLIRGGAVQEVGHVAGMKQAPPAGAQKRRASARKPLRKAASSIGSSCR